MNRYRLLALVPLACCLAGTSLAQATQEVATVSADAEAASQAPALPEDAIAQINDVPIPYDWFLHEFRSSFFQQADSDEARQEAFDMFMRKMKLYALAQKEGLLDDPRLRSQIDDKVAKQRAYFEYQLDMTEVNAGIQAYLTLFGITPESITVTDVELDQFIEQDVSSRRGQPFSVEGLDVPDTIRAKYRQKLLNQKHQEAILQHLEMQKDLVEVQVDEEAVKTVPLPTIVPTEP